MGGLRTSKVAMMYLWTVPFFLTSIARTYGSRLSEILPYAKLVRIIAASMAAAVVFLPRRYLSAAWGGVACVVGLGTAYARLTALLFARSDLTEGDAIRNAITRIVTLASRRPKR